MNPVTQGYLTDEISRANKGGYDAVVIVMDTPGGLVRVDAEDRQGRARLQGAGDRLRRRRTARAPPPPASGSARRPTSWRWRPQTNIGSSTPINLGGTNIQSDLRRKVVNDAAASLVALAASHDRNAVWAAQAVRVASNLPARTALRKNVIDVVSPACPRC